MRAKKTASLENIENFLHAVQNLVDDLGDDRIDSEFSSLIEDTCKENDICYHCFTKIDEAWTSEGLVRSCNCRTKRLSA